MARVYITDRVINSGLEESILGSDVSTQYDANAEVLMVWRQNVTREYLTQFTHLKAIIRYGVGYDRVDLEAAAERGIYVCNVPDYCTDEVADTALSMILNLTRGVFRLDHRGRTFTEKWQHNSIENTHRTSSLTLGIIGAGRIGANVLEKAKALKFNTQFYDPYIAANENEIFSAKRVFSLDELLRTSDIVSLHIPLTNETKKSVNKLFIETMKKGSFLINTARGHLIENIDIFYDFLKSQHLAGIALDAIPEEPPSEKSKLIKTWKSQEQWLEGRLIINPHNAYFSEEAAYEMRTKAAENALLVLQEKVPHNIVNLDFLREYDYA